MKKILLNISAAILTAFLPQISNAQYSNASLNGPWITNVGNYAYILFDGAGTVNEMGSFSGVTGSSIGTYTVATNGSYSGVFTAFGNMPFSGQLLAADTGNLVINSSTVTLFKVMSPGALADSIKGTLFDDTSNVTKNVMFKMNASGQIVAATGLSGVTGRVYAENGIFTGFIHSTDPDCEWKKFRIDGTYANNILTGALGQDCNDGGTVNLTRYGNAILNSIKDQFEKLNAGIYPNPFVDKVHLALGEVTEVNVSVIDLTGKLISRETVSGKDLQISGLERLTPGIYFLQVSSEGKTASFKLVKK